MSESIGKCQNVYEMLEDQESRDIYINKLNWLISHDQKYLNWIIREYMPDVHILAGKSLSDLKESMPKDRKIVLYGAGSIGRKILPFWQDDERLIGFCSQTREKQENGYCGYPVISPEELLARRDLTVFISTTRADEEIWKLLMDGGYPAEQVHRFANYSYEDPAQYFPSDIIHFAEEEVFVDVGCYDLNNALELRRRCGSLKRVYALEPDPESYAVCQAKKERFAFAEVELLPVGAWSTHTTLRFNADNSGTSSVRSDGEAVIRVAPIDELIDQPVTMIKMDIEGSELEALKGARNTILRDRPKLAICIYHKPEDMIEIPLYVKQLVPEYKLYIRHHSSSEAETVLYAVLP